MTKLDFKTALDEATDGNSLCAWWKKHKAAIMVALKQAADRLDPASGASYCHGCAMLQDELDNALQRRAEFTDFQIKRMAEAIADTSYEIPDIITKLKADLSPQPEAVTVEEFYRETMKYRGDTRVLADYIRTTYPNGITIKKE